MSCELVDDGYLQRINFPPSLWTEALPGQKLYRTLYINSILYSLWFQYIMNNAINEIKNTLEATNGIWKFLKYILKYVSKYICFALENFILVRVHNTYSLKFSRGLPSIYLSPTFKMSSCVSEKGGNSLVIRHSILYKSYKWGLLYSLSLPSFQFSLLKNKMERCIENSHHEGRVSTSLFNSGMFLFCIS